MNAMTKLDMFDSQYKMFGDYGLKTERPGYRHRSTSKLLYLVVIILIFGVTFTVLNIYELHRMRTDHEHHHQELSKLPTVEGEGNVQTYIGELRPIVWIQGNPASKNNGPTGYLKHVYKVFENMGFEVGGKMSDWVIAWIHNYPFITYSDIMKDLKPYQKVNHLPGSGYITNKVNLAQTKMDFIPKAFQIPSKKKEFLEYAEKHKDTVWVQKNNQHRGIEVKHVEEVDLTKNGSFVQEFVSNPFLIDGHKFDIGIYTIITSLDPLRLYVVDGDALFRFCPLEYHPFDSALLDKYVVGDDYLPLWNVPSLGDLFTQHDYTFKNTFNEYLGSLGKNTTALWQKLQSAIRKVVLAKEPELIKSFQKYASKRNFFEMIRFDFVLDENMKVFLMEGNMSPNLSSDHFVKNARLYEHVIFNLLNLVGVGHYTSSVNQKALAHEEEMRVSSRDTQVFPDYCGKRMCANNCKPLICKLCNACLSRGFRIDLKIAYLEHIQRGSTRRIFPPAISQADALKWTPDSKLPVTEELNLKNKLMFMWFIGKCRLDAGWCF